MRRVAKKKKTVVKRRVVRKSVRRAPLTRVNRNVNELIAPRYITVMKYSDQITPAAASIPGGASSYQFRLNSLFDPDLTGVGHQPMGFDQLTPLYSRYRVFAVTYKITFYPSANTGAVFVVPENDSTTLLISPYSVIKERPNSIIKVSSIDKPTVIKGHITLPKLNGSTTAAYMADDRFQSINNTNPSEVMALNVGGIGTSTTASYPFNIDLIFHAEWFDPVPLAQS